MPHPQSGADRPADGGTPAAGRDQDPAVADESTPSHSPSSTPSSAGPAAPDDETTDATAAANDTAAANGPATAPADDGSEVTVPVGGASDGTRVDATPAGDPPGDGPPGVEPPASPEPTRVDPAPGPEARPAPVTPPPPITGPDPTKIDARPDRTTIDPAAGPPPAPRWSGSAPVPPPPQARRRIWGESAEPTPPPAPVGHDPLPAPESQTPVDPWAGVDTGSWDLHSAELPPLPPTVSYPTPSTTRRYPGPLAGSAPVVGPGTPPVAHPVTPSQPARPVSPAAVRPVSPPPAHQVVPSQARPMAPPPPPQPSQQQQRPAPPPRAPRRRRRRWPWVLLLSIACCCGCPAYWVKPMWEQYPASAALPPQIADLSLRDDARSQTTAKQLEAQVRQSHLLSEDTFAGVYASRAGKPVTVFGGTGFRLTPEGDATDEMNRLKEQYQLQEAQVVETDVRGRFERCAIGALDGTDVVVCTSVDHGSLTTGVFTQLSVDDSARLLKTMRERIVTADRETQTGTGS
ncbi:hypothetical protein [Micromonospora sp. RTGN7]|uniref:hypothetical protein n=1 Tax=Micromonospora sp. RTGN7 TaxID=3016526 RepID=UPI0029FF22C6|nr:hypothetical protein [Micromonospora sp. RTGN7]